MRSGVSLMLAGLLLAGGSEAAVAGAVPASNGRDTLGTPTCRAGRAGRRGRKRHVFLEQRVPAMKKGLPNVLSLGALVVDLDSGQELYERKPDQPRPIASISKLAAALVVMDRNVGLEELTTIKHVDADVARGGAPSRLLEGMTLTNRDLLHAALMGSDNRAVAALGRAVGLSASQFAAAMTKKAQDLGLRQTRFLEPTGLSPENVSTPREIITLLRAVMDHPVLGPIVKRVEYDAHPVARPAVHYVNTHRPAARSNTQVLGGKTGYTDVARYCLVLVGRVGGRTLGMAFLGTEGKLTRFGDVARVADWVVSRHPQGTATALAKAAPAPLATPMTPTAAASSLATPDPTAVPGLLPALGPTEPAAPKAVGISPAPAPAAQSAQNPTINSAKL